MNERHTPDQHPQRKPTNSKVPNAAVVGLIAGIIFPLLAIVVLYLFWGDGDIGYYFEGFIRWGYPPSMEKSSKIVSLALVANLIPFYFFLNKHKYLSTRGVLLGSAIYVVLIFLYKFVWQ